MADNYLERRMDDYRSGRLNTKPTPRTSLPKDALVLRYPAFALLVIAGGSEYDEVVIEQLCRVGLKVSFTHPDHKAGTALAQRAGARLYPATMDMEQILADMDVRRTPASLVLVAEGCEVPACGPLPAFRYAHVPEVDMPVSARLLLFALHPDCRPLLLSGGFRGLVRVS